jgi:hypothetical protein
LCIVKQNKCKALFLQGLYFVLFNSVITMSVAKVHVNKLNNSYAKINVSFMTIKCITCWLFILWLVRISCKNTKSCWQFFNGCFISNHLWEKVISLCQYNYPRKQPNQFPWSTTICFVRSEVLIDSTFIKINAL